MLKKLRTLAGAVAIIIAPAFAFSQIVNPTPGGNGSGTVTSVGLSLPNIFAVAGSPVTSEGTLTATFNNQGQNTFFAGPVSGSGQPTFRTLQTTDIPAGGITNGRMATNSVGTVNIIDANVTAAKLAAGAAISNMGSQTANTVLAAPNGSAGSPAFRALATADIPTGTSGANIPLLSTANTWSGVQTFSNPAGASSSKSFAIAGNATPVPASKAAIPFEWKDSTFATENIGGIWSGNTYMGWSFNKEFNSSNTTGGTNSPASALYSFAYNNGSVSDVVSQMSIAWANTSNATAFGANIIAGSPTGITTPKLVGLEVDIEPSAGVIPKAGSAGIYVNGFNSAIPGPAMQTGGVGGGTFANGVVLYGIDDFGFGFGVGSGETMGSAANFSAGTYTNAAIVLGNTGPSQGISFGPTGGTAPIISGDPGNNVVLRVGTNGQFQINNNANNATLVQLGKMWHVSQLPGCNATYKGAIWQVDDANSPSWNGALTGGGSSVVLAICDGSTWRAH